MRASILGVTLLTLTAVGALSQPAHAQSVNVGAFAGLLGMQAAKPRAMAAAVEEPPLPPEKNVIKIYGLDEGVREIPVEPKKN